MGSPAMFLPFPATLSFPDSLFPCGLTLLTIGCAGAGNHSGRRTKRRERRSLQIRKPPPLLLLQRKRWVTTAIMLAANLVAGSTPFLGFLGCTF